jgi:hypothetical protein
MIMSDRIDPRSAIRCKPKHRAIKSSSMGQLRTRLDVRSRCPGWVTDELQRKLIENALVEPGDDRDSYGRPRRVWNAVDHWVFVGVSSNEPVPAYNCYPEVPATTLMDELQRRAERTIEEVLADEDFDGAS